MKKNNLFEEASQAIEILDKALLDLQTYRDAKAVEISKYLRMSKGIELDPEAIYATLARPYTILPINEDEAWLIHWKGIRMPIMGWVVSHEPAFTKSKISRSMKWFTPFPKWIDDEMGWKPPKHGAVIDGNNSGIRITSGDEGSFKKKYGQFLGNSRGNGEFSIRAGDAWIKLVSALISDGILPYQPKAVDAKHWNSKAKISPMLLEILETLKWKEKRPYLERAVEQWKAEGATTFNLPPGSGKSLIFQLILTKFVGKVLLLGDTKNLIQQWAHDLPERVPGADVTLSTYQGAEKYRNIKWDLVLFDEAQRVPANSFSKLAFLQTEYRAGATGTAWREKNQHLIVALCGRPFYIPWEELIAADILRKPRIKVVTVANEIEKIKYTKMLLSKRKGRSWVYCDWIDRGKAIAEALKVPFVYGETPNGLQQIKDNEVCVVSKVADRGISLRDLRLVIEVAGAGKSREQFGQRVGRLLHGQFEGEFYTLFTPEEIQKYKSRIFGVEAELGGQVEIEFLEIGHIKDPTGPVNRPAKPSRAPEKAVQKVKASKPLDEIGKILAIPSVEAKIVQAERSASFRGKRLVRKVIRYCWDTPLSPKDIAEGLGNTGSAFLKDAKNACLSNVKAGLMIENKGLYHVNRSAFERLKTLNDLRNK